MSESLRALVDDTSSYYNNYGCNPVGFFSILKGSPHIYGGVCKYRDPVPHIKENMETRGP